MHDPKSIRPKGKDDNFVIVLDEMKSDKTTSGLYKPDYETNAEKVTEGSGVLIRLGVGNRVSSCGIKEGQRVFYRSFLKYANEIPTDEHWENGTKKKYFFMSVDDLLGIIDDSTEVGVYSGRPKVKGK